MGHSFMLYLHQETYGDGAQNEGAYLVSEDGDEDGAAWIPKSQVEERDRIEDPTGYIMTKVLLELPEWLAKKRGLIE